MTIGDQPGAGDEPRDPAVEIGQPEDTLAWPIRRFQRGGTQSALYDKVVREQRVELVLNGVPLLAMLALPRDVEALALGFLVSEGLVKSCDDLPVIQFDNESGQILCSGAFDEEAMESIHRRWTFGTGCGGGGTGRDPSRLAQCRPISSPTVVTAAQLAALGHMFLRKGVLYRQTGGVHASGLADQNEVLLFAEDVGRHNAFDKVMGMALQMGMKVSDKIALTTGRLSAEIVSKAVTHGVPILASSSAPTAMGVRWSRSFSLTLVGFLRGQRMNVYTGYHRVIAAIDEAGNDAVS